MERELGKRREQSPLTGRTYCFTPKMIIIPPNRKKVMLNQYIHELCSQTLGDGDEIYLSLEDLVRIFSPDWEMGEKGTILCGGVPVCFQADYRDVRAGEDTVILKKAPLDKEDRIYVPVKEVMERIFGKYVFRYGKYMAVCDSKEEVSTKFDGPKSQEFTERRLDFRFEKEFGDRYFTIWMPKERRLNVYRMYIPSGYDGSKPYKLLVCLHGGNGNSDSPFIRSGQLLQYYAERYGYILLAPNSYVHGSNYGGIIPPVHMFPEPEVKTEKPEYYPSEVVEENRSAQQYLKNVLDQVLEKWNIDRYHIFVTGNSMGSIGTFHLLSAWPELFRAGAPTAAMPLTEYLDVERLKNKPIFYLVGTEDANDPEDMKRRYLELKEKGLDIRFKIIGGGYHSDAWVMELETIFEFFEQF